MHIPQSCMADVHEVLQEATDKSKFLSLACEPVTMRISRRTSVSEYQTDALYGLPRLYKGHHA